MINMYFYDAVITAILHGEGAIEHAIKIVRRNPIQTRMNAGIQNGKLIVQLELPQEAVVEIVRGEPL